MAPPYQLNSTQIARFVAQENASGRAAMRKKASTDHEFDEEINCCVCGVDFYHAEGKTPAEIPVMTPCGHIFGQKCLQKWRRQCKQARKPVTCPTCRFPMQFKCGHTMSPLYAFCTTTPPKITQEQAPRRCFDCYIKTSTACEKSEVCRVVDECYQKLTDKERKLLLGLMNTGVDFLSVLPPEMYRPGRKKIVTYTGLWEKTQDCQQRLAFYKSLRVDRRIQEKKDGEYMASSWRISWGK